MALLIVIAGYLIYCTAVVVYRLYISPLSQYPGPKLAAASWVYEIYYEVVKTGQFYKQIERLHDIYGPVVRINPVEIHIRDHEWFSELYTSVNRARDKPGWFLGPSGGQSIFSTEPHALHRKRRAALNPFFSQKAVTSLEPVIQSNAEKLCERVMRQVGTANVLELKLLYFAFAIDTFSHYAFGEAFGSLDREDLGEEREAMLRSATESTTIARYFPWMVQLVNMLPESVAAASSTPIAGLLKMRREILERMESVFAKEKDEKSPIHRTMFENIRDSNLPAEEKTIHRLLDEAVVMVGAAGEPPAFTLATLTFHLLNNPDVHKKLVSELDGAMPDPNATVSLQTLEHLPYLRATVSEAHRITSFFTGRMIRTAPHEVLRYRDWEILPGTQISMTQHWTHFNPELFPDPHTFRPERFLDADSDSSPAIEKYLMPFSRGSRSCIGLNLARAEIYLAAAYVVRRFDLRLFDTTLEDVEITWDRFTGGTRPESQGVRIQAVGLRP